MSDGQIDDRFDAPTPPPSDFPTDQVVHHHYIAWGTLVVLVILLVWLVSFLYRMAQRDAILGLGKAIELRVARVETALKNAAKAPFDKQIEEAEGVKGAFNENFSKTMTLSKALNGAVKPLMEALEGQKEELAKPGTGMPSTVTGGTIINIAVNQGHDGPSVAAGAPMAEVKADAAPEDNKMSEDEKTRAVWMAVQSLFDYWKTKTSVIMAFRSVQEQLLRSPRWEPPKEDNPFHPAYYKGD